MKIVHYLLFLSLITTFSSCTLKQKKAVPQSADNTAKIQIIEASPNYSFIYENLKTYTQNGISAEHRELAWRRLYEAKTLDQKLFHAADYIDSFDFQAWNWGFSDVLIQEDQKLRDYVVAHDLLELSLSLTELLSKLRSYHSEDVFTNDRNLQSFYAITASLGDVVPPAIQDIVTHSLYETIQHGLQKKNELDNGLITAEQLTRSDNEVIKNDVLFKDTLYARFQYLAYIAAKTFNTDPDQAAEAVNFALATRDFLKSIGVEVHLDKKIRKLLSKIKSADEAFNQNLQNLMVDEKAKKV